MVKKSKRFVAGGRLTRLVMGFCFCIGLMSVWIRQPNTEQTSTRFLVEIPPKLPESETIIQNRNLADYDLGDRFSDCAEASNDEIQQCDNALEKGRDFIWSHWKAKKRSYVVYLSTRADTSNELHTFIEPDENGTWHIIQRWQVRFPYQHTYTYYEIASVDSTIIKRKPVTKNDKKMMGGKFYLIFFNRDGEELRRL